MKEEKNALARKTPMPNKDRKMIEIFNQNRLLTAEEVGQALGVKPSTISKWVFENKIPYVKFGPGQKSIVMFNPQRLNQWIVEKSHEPESKEVHVFNHKKDRRTNKKAVERFEEFVSKL